ncbi:hypothetical protein [Catalinimonas niigatensis]|uniref:hypothetical protein n=1 Tax=Catalinimonas niigatensis TaxID=1397264 RepID=UPI0026665D4C|nr:hypothetical protein [Catalinimonas niigatensis]WPP51753.1 hypothetical protein PZB72_05050 [Catalinimonas niigatensis]
MEDSKLTLNSFCQLSENHRTKYTWLYGNLLATQTASEYSYHLYLVDGFYVELVFDRRVREIISIDPLLRTENLLKYLDEVSIDVLL